MALTKNNFYSYITIAFLSFALLSSTLFSIDFVSSQSSGTEVSGIITADTTWTQANSPYTLTGNVLVQNGATLTIEPGTNVDLNSYYIQVNGTLSARGATDEKINFNEGTIRFASVSDAWNTTTNIGCIIEKCVLNSTTISIEDTSLLVINNYFDNSRVECSNGINCISSNFFTKSTLSLTESNSTISNNTFVDCSTAIGARTGISVTTSFPLIEGNLICGSEIGIGISSWYWAISYSPIIYNNALISNSRGISINMFLSRGISPLIEGNNFFNNTNYNIELIADSSEYSSDINATYNWWGVVNAQAINQSIYDFYDDFNVGAVVFEPFLYSPNTAAPTYTNASASAGGSISPSGITKLNYGDNITFTIAADSGYHLVDVLVNGTSIGATGSCSIEDISGATEIIANFEIDPTPTPTPTASPTPT
ncbi:MAG: hypothetical protein GX648_03415, partial [Crenarchaeota archaeon]|nr:hypothetical protein [Thermoproteota archaeon]